MRSKGDIDINAIAKEFGGGGHKNASGCSVKGDLPSLKAMFEQKLADAIEKASGLRPQASGLGQA
jgi:phosphoesterase RecJ-like protein